MLLVRQIIQAVTLSVALSFAVKGSAGELVHGFVNPEFGGSPLNGAYLLSNAAAQNNHTAKSASSITGTNSPGSTNSAQQFAEQVNQLVMSSVAYRVVNQAFGESGKPLPDNSSLNTGINTVSVQYYEGGVRVTVVDNKTGGRSVIDIPNY